MNNKLKVLYNIKLIAVISAVISFYIVAYNINVQYSSYLPGVFFTVGLSSFALRITITTSFTEKSPQDDNSIKNLKFFNKSLEKFIVYSLIYGGVSAILYPIYCLTSDNKFNYDKVSLNVFIFHNGHRIISCAIMITLLLYVLRNLIQITKVTTQIINEYISETNSRYLKDKYEKQNNH